jgi:hypothetical protein
LVSTIGHDSASVAFISERHGFAVASAAASIEYIVAQLSSGASAKKAGSRQRTEKTVGFHRIKASLLNELRHFGKTRAPGSD